MFGRDFYLINDIVIDFILCKNGKVIAGIELIDEPEELAYKKGEEMLISTIFARLGYKFFNITDTSKLKESAKTIKREIKN